MKTISLAVRDFALPVPRRGSIDMHSGLNMLSQGQEIHELVQKERKREFPVYKSEQKISRIFSCQDYKFSVSGRLDGVIEGYPPLIEEIKSSTSIHLLKAKMELDSQHPYILQTLCYGYMYYKELGFLPKLQILLVSSTRISERLLFPLELDLAVFEEWLEKRLNELVLEMQTLESDILRRVEIGSKLEFPFKKARPGQMDLIESVKTGISDKASLLVQAPTGLGKTVAMLFPALKDSLLRGQKLIYLTPKNSQHAIAEDAANKLRAQMPGEDLRSITLTAKAKICFKPEPICTPEYCQYAKDYYAKVQEHKLLDLTAAIAKLDQAAFSDLGKTYEVCPFELSLDSVARADLLIADYNYVFSPKSIIGRISQHNDLIGQKPNLLIDEAHNLADRACDYYSPNLRSETFDEALDQAKRLSPSLAIRAQSLISSSLSIIDSLSGTEHNGSERNERKVDLESKDFEAQDKLWREFLAEYLQSGQYGELKDSLLRAADSWSKFRDGLRLAEGADGNFFAVSKRWGESKIELKLNCCDASSFLKETYTQFAATIAFSATLKPFDYFISLCGFEKEQVKTLECVSPFPKDNRKLLLIPQVSTKYKDRKNNYAKIADTIKRVTALKPGNYFAFFPSFEFLAQVAEIAEAGGLKISRQRQDMKPDEVLSFIKEMQASKNKGQAAVFFAVQGGVFAEGVDYPGDSLIGAFIVGPALPKYDLERELLKDYYERRYQKGFDYAYTYPAMTRVVQSAGRVIRSENDRGIIILMDRRFLEINYAAAMPQDWFDLSVRELVSNSILKDLNQFWNLDEKQVLPPGEQMKLFASEAVLGP